MTVGDTTNGLPPQNRYRLPGIEREGIAQLSILETALWPVRGGKLPHSTFETEYTFTSTAGRETAHVSVFSPDGLQSIDEYILWRLLALSLDRSHPESTLLATPYWLIQQLGMSIGGFQYDQLRASLERLAKVAYQNTGFFNPLTKQHERITLHFFSSFIPTNGRGGDIATDRVWRIEWDQHFFALSQATGGNLLFDLDLYRTLTPASRRLFLKLKDRFWRTKRVFLNVNDLTINGLGFSADRPLKKRKYDLLNCIRELLDNKIIELGPGQTDPKDLIIKRGKGLYVVSLYEGEYFRTPLSGRATSQENAIAGDPLFEPLRKIGVDSSGIRRLFKEFARGQIQRWISITDAAMHEKPQGFLGFKVSPAAFLIDGVQNQRLPPDWIYAHEKRQKREQWERERAASNQAEHHLRTAYEQERAAALQKFLQSEKGREQYQHAFPILLQLYERTEPHRPREAAHEVAVARIEQHHFQFLEYAVWVLTRREQGIDTGA